MAGLYVLLGCTNSDRWRVSNIACFAIALLVVLRFEEHGDLAGLGLRTAYLAARMLPSANTEFGALTRIGLTTGVLEIAFLTLGRDST